MLSVYPLLLRSKKYYREKKKKKKKFGDRRWRAGQLGSPALLKGGRLRVSRLQTKALLYPIETPYVAHILSLCFILKLVIVSR